jgi:hypothetical protein
MVVVWFASCDFARSAFVEHKEAAVRFHDLALRGKTVEVPQLVGEAPDPEVLVYREADSGKLVRGRAVF